MAEIACFLSLLIGLRSHNTCNQEKHQVVNYSCGQGEVADYYASQHKN